MENQPTNDVPTPGSGAQPNEALAPTVTPTVVAPAPSGTLSDPTPSGPAPVYPTASVGAPSPGTSATKPNPLATLSALSPQGGDRLPLIMAVAANAFIPLLAFMPGLIDSMAKIFIWLILMVALSASSLWMAAKSQQQSERVKVVSVITIVLATMALMTAIILGSYSIKAQLVLNELNNMQYDSADI